ncbi:MAG: GNAT family N-acyltransferase [Acidimicrobiales bacterium]
MDTTTITSAPASRALDLDQAVDLDALAAAAIAEGGRGDTPFGLYVIPSAAPAAELARAVERDVFFEYFGNTAEMLAAEYDPYEAASVYLCVIDHLRGRAAGAMRLILPSPAGLKTTVDLEHAWAQPVGDVLERTGLELPASRVWDIATIAVTPEYRGASTNGLISLAMYQGVIQLARHRDVRWVLAILDLVVLDLIQQGTGRPFSTFDGVEPMSYLDSPSRLPVWCDLQDYDERLAITDPGMHEILFLSRGLEAAVSIPSWDSGVPRGTSGDRDLAATA